MSLPPGATGTISCKIATLVCRMLRLPSNRSAWLLWLGFLSALLNPKNPLFYASLFVLP